MSKHTLFQNIHHLHRRMAFSIASVCRGLPCSVRTVQHRWLRGSVATRAGLKEEGGPAVTSVVDEMKNRGLIADTTSDRVSELFATETMTAYCGFDPTASTLHVGNLVRIRKQYKLFLFFFFSFLLLFLCACVRARMWVPVVGVAKQFSVTDKQPPDD